TLFRSPLGRFSCRHRKILLGVVQDRDAELARGLDQPRRPATWVLGDRDHRWNVRYVHRRRGRAAALAAMRGTHDHDWMRNLREHAPRDVIPVLINLAASPRRHAHGWTTRSSQINRSSLI